MNEHYDRETLSKLDIISSFYIDIFVNKLYEKAINIKSDNSSIKSLTEAYRIAISTYIQFSKKNEYYKTFIQGISYYTSISTKYQNMNHKEIINFYCAELVPRSYFNSISDKQKNNMLNMVITNCLAMFAEKIMMNYIVMIIDNHDDGLEDHIGIMQEDFLKIILNERDKCYCKFINPNIQNKTINIEQYNAIKDKFNGIITEKQNLVKELENKNNIIQNLKNKYDQLVKELKLRTQQCTEFKEIIDGLLVEIKNKDKKVEVPKVVEISKEEPKEEPKKEEPKIEESTFKPIIDDVSKLQPIIKEDDEFTNNIQSLSYVSDED